MAIISIYAIEEMSEDSTWEEAWTIVEESYGVDAICRNVLESNANVEDEILSLKQLNTADSKLREILKSELDAGATHAFIQPLKGKALFGVSLKKIFG